MRQGVRRQAIIQRTLSVAKFMNSRIVLTTSYLEIEINFLWPDLD